MKRYHLISACSKLVQKVYKTRHDRVEKVINKELCKRLKFDHTTKWCMHNPESILENETHKIFWNFEIQTDHIIPARRPDLTDFNKKNLNKKKNLLNSGLCHPSRPQSENQRKQTGRQVLRPCQRNKIVMKP